MPEYGSVVLTLSNVLLPSDKLYPNATPSMIEGLPYDVEYDLRLIGCELIQTACLLLRLPQTAVATGQVLFHRYFYSSSFIRRPMEIFAMACTNLAAKIEENARRIRDVINVFHHIKQIRSGKTIRPLLIDQVYIDRKNEVIKAERRLLKELGFCVYVKHPHKTITLYLKVLEKEREKNLVQTAWNYMNDSLRTDIFLRFTPETIACACIDLAARILQISLPKNPPWFIIFGAKSDEIHYIMIAILRLYKHRPKSLDELEKIVNTIREKREDERKKLRPDTNQQIDLGNDSPLQQQPQQQQQQITQNSISSTVINTTMTVIQQNIPTVIATTQETTNVTTTTTTTTNGKIIKKHDRGSSRESSTVNTHRHHHSRKKRSSTQSRSSSQSSSYSPIHRSQKKKKTSHRSRSRSRSSTPKRRKHQKDKRHHSRSSNHRKKDKKRRSRSSTSEENHFSKTNNKHPLSTKDTNHNIHQRSHHHHHHHHHSNGVSSSSSSHKKLKN
ncbi:unnamed protein product [Rotaria sordida]|uniref:Cyclin-like domain-containing protein n=1 Tax=Rotaria sordida TaxID=392033 RepID=A0A819EFY0_9BILA|nr:unnamed protein product [Rotaria sordida]CAF0803361.1 unnamed protein product [Rotaria sordida]CAF0804603.1 unnamed protein product [Rotaria sordida]CAF0812852.1 unnamed protein product [Rotaria sordida]CAF3664289.1 unnamed protein product [Rotaria sordida]